MLIAAIVLSIQLFTPSQAKPAPIEVDTISVAELREVYTRIFRPTRGERDGQASYRLIVNGDSLPEGHPLTGFVRENRDFLFYLGLHSTQPHFIALVEDEPSSAELQQRYHRLTTADPVFRQIVEPMMARYLQQRNIIVVGMESSTSLPTLDMRSVADVAVRFFYPETVLPDGRVQSYICAGISGVLDFDGERNFAVEAFAYSAIFRELRAPKHDMMRDFQQAEALIDSLNLSSDPQVRVTRAQGVMWAAMVGSERLQNVLFEEFQLKQDYLPLVISDAR